MSSTALYHQYLIKFSNLISAINIKITRISS